MANGYTTTDELKTQALWMAGEPTNGQSDYEDQVLNYLQLVYDTVLNGGTLGTRDIAISAGLYNQLINIPTCDWKWLRKYPPFAFNTTPAVIGSSAGIPLNQGTQIDTVTVTYGSDIINFGSTPPPVDCTNWRLQLLNQEQGIPNPPITIPRIAEHAANLALAVLDAPWPQQTQTVSDFAVFQLVYDLPTDFIRFCESPLVQGGYSNTEPGWLAVGDMQAMQNVYPLNQISYGPPDAAGRLDPTQFQVNRYDTFSYRIEFSYIYQIPALEVGATPDPQEPVIPLRFRHILAIGAAMLISQDKVDGREDRLSSEFREIMAQMVQEYNKENISSSQRMGRMLFRGSNRQRNLLRTASGLPLW